MKTISLILINIFLFIFAIVLSLKIFNFASFGNLLVSRITGQPVCKDCNVILISLDTLSANHLPCYGYSRNTAPNLCKFGKENIMFKNMFSNANYTLPSHVSIFTGLYTRQHRIDDLGTNYLPPNIPFLPEILQKQGYKTYFYMPTNDPHLPIDLVYYRGINQIIDTSHPNDWWDGLKKLKTNSEKGQKTFLFLHTYWVHAMYIPENKDRSIYAKNMNEYNLPETNEKMARCTSDFLKYLKKVLKYDLDTGVYKNDKKLFSIYESMYKKLVVLSYGENELQFCNIDKNKEFLYVYFQSYYSSFVDMHDKKTVQHLLDLYDSKIVELDEYLNGVFSYVQSSNLKKNTIIIITADHGEEFMEHGKWGHGRNLYDTSLKVPLIIHIPGQKNNEVTQLAQSVDIFPTLLSLLGLNSTYKGYGLNLMNKYLFLDTRTIEAEDNFDGTTVIRSDEWKLFYRIENNKPIGLQLFNYKNDPQEKNNVIFTNNEVVERLLRNISN